ncbi:hypothetical protein VCHC39A1_3609, partial [Vibrio cholerae HC-39A1]
MLQIRVLVSIQ